jgi:hypothetical protein
VVGTQGGYQLYFDPSAAIAVAKPNFKFSAFLGFHFDFEAWKLLMSSDLGGEYESRVFVDLIQYLLRSRHPTEVNSSFLVP